MWFLNIYNSLSLENVKSLKKTLIFYNEVFYYFISPHLCKKWRNFIYTTGNLNLSRVFMLTFETKTVRFRYVGKSYRISKKKKILLLKLHFPTFKYLLWSNIKLKKRKKKRKSFKFKCLSLGIGSTQLFMNLFRLRIPNTYTKRGIYNNIFTYYNRKRKLSTHR